MQSLLGDGDQHISADCDPDLSLHDVLVSAQKRLDAQVLLDPFEKQFHLPALPVQVRDQLGCEGEVVRQKSVALAGLVPGYHTARRRGATLAGIENSQDVGLIANVVGSDPVYRLGIAPLELGVGLGAGHKEGGDPLGTDVVENKSWSRRSNRVQTEIPKSHGTSST